MADRMDTTDLWLTEPLLRGMGGMILRFAAAVRSLIVLTAAERDLGDDADQDPAFAAYTGAVDAARARTLAHAEALAAPDAEGSMARGMQIVAQMIRTVITTDAPSEVAMIRNISAMRGKTVLLPVFRYHHPQYNALMRFDPAQRKVIEAHLIRNHARATRILEANRAPLLALATALDAEGILQGDALAGLLSAVIPEHAGDGGDKVPGQLSRTGPDQAAALPLSPDACPDNAPIPDTCLGAGQASERFGL